MNMCKLYDFIVCFVFVVVVMFRSFSHHSTIVYLVSYYFMSIFTYIIVTSTSNICVGRVSPGCSF